MHPLSLARRAARPRRSLPRCRSRRRSAQVKIGVTLSTTGPAVSLGIPEKNTIAMLPKTIGGKSVEYIVLDDASDSSAAVVRHAEASSARTRSTRSSARRRRRTRWR